MQTRTEWGLQHDCELSGCDPVHSDNGRVFSFDILNLPGDQPPRSRGWVNGYKCRLVSRTVTYSEWEPHT